MENRLTNILSAEHVLRAKQLFEHNHRLVEASIPLLWEGVLAAFDVVVGHVFRESQMWLIDFADNVIELAKGITLKPNPMPDRPFEVVFPEPTEDRPLFGSNEIKVGAAFIWMLTKRKKGFDLCSAETTIGDHGEAETPSIIIRFDINNGGRMVFINDMGNIGITNSYIGAREMKDCVFRLAQHPELTAVSSVFANKALPEPGK